MTILTALHLSDLFVIGIFWLIAYLLQKVLQFFHNKYPYLQLKKSIYFYRIEIIIWSIFVLTSFLYLANRSIIFTTLLLLFLTVAFWSFWKDFFAYVIIKFNNEIQPGEQLSIDNISGTVKQLTTRFLVLSTNAGQEEIIPLHLLADKKITKLYNADKPYPFTIKTTQNLNKIRTQLYRSPWVIKHYPLKINSIENEIQVSGYTFNEQTLAKLISTFKNKS